MVSRHLRLALRRFRRHRLTSTLNLVGLAAGLACALILLRYVQNELIYDSDIQNVDRMYRFSIDIKNGDNRNDTAVSGWDPAPLLQEEFPEVEEYTRLQPLRNVVLSTDEYNSTVEKGLFAEANALDFFSVPLITGDPSTALSRPGTAVISQRLAATLFPDGNAVGGTVRVNQGEPLEITGILASTAPRHFSPELYVSNLEDPQLGHPANGWMYLAYYTYLRLAKTMDLEEFEAALPTFVEKHAGEWVNLTGMELFPRMTSVQSIHLHSHFVGELEANGDISRVILFGSIAAIIILIACINFVNISTAQATARASEVGLRKVVGAERKNLVVQFLAESLLQTGTAFLLAILLAYLFMPQFNKIAAMQIELNLFQNPALLFEFLGVFVLVGLIAGGIPALTLSSFRPLEVIRGQIRRGPGGKRLRRVLVITQFTASAALIIGTFIVGRQLNYLNSRDLGFEKDHLVVLQLKSDDLRQRASNLEEMLKKNPRIISFTRSSNIPGKPHGQRLLVPEGLGEGETFRAGLLTADENFVETFGMELKEGRFLDPNRAADSVNWVINETFAYEMGWDQPVGMSIEFPPKGTSTPGMIVGVIRDYHHLTLHNKVQAMAWRLGVFPKTYLTLRISPTDVGETIDYLRGCWDEFAPEWSFDYMFLDSVLEQNYTSEKHFGEMFGAFAALAIAVAALGLLGLAAFVAESRTHEIGVRKVLGASVRNVVFLLTREFFLLVLIGNLLAWPAIYFGMSRWLEGFAYHTDPGIWPFVAGLLLSLIIAIVTVSGHAIRAAHTNPATTIRAE